MAGVASVCSLELPVHLVRTVELTSDQRPRVMARYFFESMAASILKELAAFWAAAGSVIELSLQLGLDSSSALVSKIFVRRSSSCKGSWSPLQLSLMVVCECYPVILHRACSKMIGQFFQGPFCCRSVT